MHMIIVGCGRVGSTLAKELSSEGHDVVIIDRDATAFRRVGENFTGKTITGIGFDRFHVRFLGAQDEFERLGAAAGGAAFAKCIASPS